jgi:DNA-directed RNA polymerase specialized sigma24 family protein
MAQTGGSKKAWLFDPSTIETIKPIRDALVHYDTYFFEEDTTTTLALVMDKLLEELPEDLQEAVSLVYLEGRSLRKAGLILGIDHKTVKSRCGKGIKIMKSRLTDSVWIAELIKKYIPADELKENVLEKKEIADILKSLKVEVIK